MEGYNLVSLGVEKQTESPVSNLSLDHDLHPEKIRELYKKSRRLRKDVLDLVVKRKEGHIGGSFSIVEMMITIYDLLLKKEDHFILSKGHAFGPLYLLLKERRYNPKFGGHPEIDVKNGIECTTGSLGHGLPIGVGMALAKKIKNEHGIVYVLMSDGECQEGTTWESLMLAAHHKLDNLKVLIDHNNLETLGRVDDILSLGDLAAKCKAFNCGVSEIDGHSYHDIFRALKKQAHSRPHVIIADTTKGKGVSFMENHSGWHTMIPNQEELERAYKELE